MPAHPTGPAGPEGPPPGNDDVVRELERILADGDFDASPRSRAFLRFIVDETLAGRQDGLTQDAIATRVFQRREDFDPTLDPIVRIQAGRLRRSLERYYLLAGAHDPVRIELPRGTYVPVLRWAALIEAPTNAKEAARLTPTEDDWPAVLASVFEPIPPDPELRDAATRFLNQVAVELGRYRDVRVVLRREPLPTGASPCGNTRFSLSGQLSRDGEAFCVIARLVDCHSGAQVWAEEYRGTPVPALEQKARVVAAAVASEQGAVAKRLWAEHRAQPRAPVTPYGAILASYQFFFNRDPADLAPAIESLKQVVAAEPECGLAWTQLSRLYSANYAFEVSPVETPIDHAVAYAQNGVRLDPSGQRARCAHAAALLLKGELAAARLEVQAALDLNPDSLVYLEWIGWLMTLLGEWERGPALVRRALDHNPHVIPLAHHALWLDHFRRGEMEEAYQAALQHRDPSHYLRAMTRASCLGHLGRKEEARAEVAELLAIKPDFARRGRTLIGRIIKFPDLLDRIVEGLEKAGLSLD